MISRYQKTKGFTLIELLVVISIISLLSSIVLSSVSSARDKARIAAGKQFDSHNFSGFAADALGIWDFEETSGPIVDKSQYLNNLTLAGPTFVSSGCIRGNAYNFDGNDYAYSNNSINFSILNGLTLSAWINVDSCGISGSYCKIIAFGEYYTDLYLLNQSGNIVFGISINNPNPQRAPVELKKWVHVSATCIKTSSKCTLYVNGRETNSDSTSYISKVFQNSPGVYIGRALPSSAQFFKGIIDEVRIYSNALIASEVRQLYAEGLPRHTLAEAD